MDYEYYAYASTPTVSPLLSIFFLAVCVITLAALWKIFVKAGQKGWKCLIPFYSAYIEYGFTWGNGWLFLLGFVPFVNIVVSIITCVKLAKAFGKGTGFAVGLIFLPVIFFCILAFGSAEYLGVPGKESATTAE